MPPKEATSNTTDQETPSEAPRRSTRSKPTPSTASKPTAAGTKRKPADSSSTSSSSSSKKPRQSSQKTHGSKHDSSDAPAKHHASPTHLPKQGQDVTWKAMPGWVQGHVLEIVTSPKTVEGKSVKASKEDPRIVLKSHGPSGKVAVHKAEAVWFD